MSGNLYYVYLIFCLRVKNKEHRASLSVLHNLDYNITADSLAHSQTDAYKWHMVIDLISSIGTCSVSYLILTLVSVLKCFYFVSVIPQYTFTKTICRSLQTQGSSSAVHVL